MLITVQLNKHSSQEVRVKVYTVDGTAGHPKDYSVRRTWAVFAPGQTQAQVEVKINADKNPEPNETFFVDLRKDDGCNIGANPAMVTIIDDDGGV